MVIKDAWGLGNVSHCSRRSGNAPFPTRTMGIAARSDCLTKCETCGFSVVDTTVEVGSKCEESEVADEDENTNAVTGKGKNGTDIKVMVLVSVAANMWENSRLMAYF